VAHAVARSVGAQLDRQTAMRFLEVYERELPNALPTRVGRVLPNVREVLTDLAGEPCVTNLLLTGNTRAGAAAKLAHYALDDLLTDGAFCVDTEPRAAIAKAALRVAADAGVEAPPSQRFVIGDTPHDVSCAEAIEARCIAVATGNYEVAELHQAGAWAVFEQLPPPSEFRELVGLGHWRDDAS
jgi:phosphoglycolate phosphatase